MKLRLHEEKIIKKKHSLKLVHEGQYIAEVDIDLSLEDTQKLDEVRQALRRR
jgi:hypothetical protein